MSGCSFCIIVVILDIKVIRKYMDDCVEVLQNKSNEGLQDELTEISQQNKQTNEKMQVIWCSQCQKAREHSHTSTQPPPSLTPGFILPHRLHSDLTPRADWRLTSLIALIFTSGRSENKTSPSESSLLARVLSGFQ